MHVATMCTERLSDLYNETSSLQYSAFLAFYRYTSTNELSVLLTETIVAIRPVYNSFKSYSKNILYASPFDIFSRIRISKF